MQVSVETLGSLERKLRIEVDWSEFAQKESEELGKLSKKAKLKGFRQNKPLPPHVVKQRFGQDVRYQVIGDLMKATFKDALDQEALTPANYPTFNQVQLENDKPFIYEVEFEIIPKVSLTDLTGTSIEKKVVKVAAEDIDKTLDRMRKHSADWEVAEKKAENDDQIIMDFVGTLDGEVFEGGTAQDYALVLGTHSMIEGFEDGLLGAVAGEERDLNLTFPEAYHSEDLAGKAVSFKVTIKEVKTAKLPELDDALAEKFGVKEGGIEKLREEIEQGMVREVEMKLKQELKQGVFKKFVELNPVELPPSMIEEEMKQLTQRQGDNTAEGEQDAEGMEQEARERVHLGILFGQYVEQEKVEPDPKDIMQILQSRASAYEQPEVLMSYFLKNEQMMQDIRAMAMEGQVVDKLLENADVVEIEIPYNQIMEANAE